MIYKAHAVYSVLLLPAISRRIAGEPDYQGPVKKELTVLTVVQKQQKKNETILTR